MARLQGVRGFRPLDRIWSLKTKLGIVIVGTVLGGITVLAIGRGMGYPLEPRLVSAAVFGLVVAQILARGMTSPLREMARSAKAMSEGDYTQRVRATSRDEVGDLARAFNAMADELAANDRRQRDLVANVSHELRTPIGALRVLLENLVDGVEPTDPAQLETALAQTERLGRLVAQLLDLSRLESGSIPMRREPFELGPMLDLATRECQLGDDDPVHVEWSVDPDDLVILGDAERVHQVVANLLANAVRHSPTGGTVHVTASSLRDGTGRARIEVVDEGPGIPEADLERVFERFYRTDHARASSDGGTGLGLAISRWIVDAQGGTISATRGEDGGCRMVVELPRQTPDEARED
ncbi:MAG: ATP-binding protein [Solirubrobacteraceae bacterium]|nr:ATP-binding protein [Solirubrobacteraceae bacterium]